MAKKSKKQPSSDLDAWRSYAHLSLDELAALSDAHDDEIDEDAAFTSDDEREYGQYFSSSPAGMRRARNVSLPIPLQHGTVRIVDVPARNKLALSSVCLDVSACEYDRIKLMVRCVYPNQTVGQVDDYCTLCNYLSPKKGGMGLAPATPVTWEAMGPCKVEFRAEVAPASFVDGSINVFGLTVVVPAENLMNDDDGSMWLADAFLSEEEEEVGSDSEGASDGASENDDDKLDGNEEATNATKKRKLDKPVEDHEPASSKKKRKAEVDETPPAPSAPAGPTNGDAKLSKKQRKKLAKEKARQLEETLSAARNDKEGDDADEGASEKKKAKKKKNKPSTEGNEPRAKPTSLTRERRLAGGLIVSDVLVGTGAPVRPGKRISLHYTGSLRSTGAVFDKNHSKQHPLVFRQGTGEVIRGLERGLEGMKAGGERVITIPSTLGYGRKGAGADVPPDSDLVFEVKVLKVG